MGSQRFRSPLLTAVTAALALRVLLPTALVSTAGRRPPPRTARRAGSAPLQSLRVVVVGAGPSGLLLANRLLAAGASVELLELRSDPRLNESALEGRAYALGLGMRARTAVRSAGKELWAAVQPCGFASDSFQLHLSPSLVLDLRTEKDNEGLEPSLLVYQTDLCGGMLQATEERYRASGRFQVSFGASVESVDAQRGTAVVSGPGGQRELGPVDLIAGCDGVNSVVRKAVSAACSGFEEQLAQLPGNLKVLRFPRMPAALNPATVHAIPGPGGISAFVEPTVRGACVLINWRDGSDLGELSEPSEALEVLSERFPLLRDVMSLDAAEQFVSQGATRASTVRCNTYHSGVAVLLGDAAHSTGGSSGQGCNSALQDAQVLADLLERGGGDVQSALLAFSEQRVPEGQALLELSLGPGEAAGPLRRGLYGASQFVGFLLSKLGIGPPVLQTQFTTSLTPFAKLRRERDFFFGDFPTQESFEKSIAALDAAAA